MKNAVFHALAIGIAVMGWPGGPAIAAPTTELKVQGSIKAAACLPTLGSGGIAHYDAISSASLKTGSYTILPQRQVAFALNCDFPMRVGIAVVDNRRESLVQNIGVNAGISPTGYSNINMYGLGSVAGKNLGGFRLRLLSVVGDGQPLQMFSIFLGQPYQRSGGDVMSGERINSWTSSYSDINTKGYRSVTGLLTVDPVLDKRENLPVGQEIMLDGSVTLEVTYI